MKPGNLHREGKVPIPAKWEPFWKIRWERKTLLTFEVVPEWEDFFNGEGESKMTDREKDVSTGCDRIAGRIREMLEGMRYGSITLVVQDGKVIQLEKSEKVRLS